MKQLHVIMIKTFLMFCTLNVILGKFVLLCPATLIVNNILTKKDRLVSDFTIKNHRVGLHPKKYEFSAIACCSKR